MTSFLSSRPAQIGLFSTLLFATACSSGRRDLNRSSRPVSIEIEVYDPDTNFVWENIEVRVIESQQEWSGRTLSNPSQDFYLTDRDGLVFLDEFELAINDVGFLEDPDGFALLRGERDADEAVVTVEIYADGFVPVLVDIDLSWFEPDVFVAIPFRQ